MLSEDQIQAQCVQWANNNFEKLRGFGIAHIPNGGTRNKLEANKLKAMGVRKGFPDLIVILPNGKIFFIEMKDDKGKQSEAQIECEKFMKERGIEYYLIRSIDEFKELINSKMEGI